MAGRTDEEAGFQSFANVQTQMQNCRLTVSQNAEQGTKGVKATDTMKVTNHAVSVSVQAATV